MKRLIVSILGVTTAFAISIGSPKAASIDPTTTVLLHLNDVVQQATTRYDVSTLRDYTTPDYHLTSPSGRLYDREAFLSDAADRSAVYILNDSENIAVRHYNDDTAIVTGILHIKLRLPNRFIDERVRFSDVWVKLHGRWLCANGQASRMKTR